jgi:hypothetical protein
MWQGGDNGCRAARVISHLSHPDIVSPSTHQMQTRLFNPAAVECRMDQITGAKRDLLLRQPPYRELRASSAPGRTLICFTQQFSELQSGLSQHACLA